MGRFIGAKAANVRYLSLDSMTRIADAGGQELVLGNSLFSLLFTIVVCLFVWLFVCFAKRLCVFYCVCSASRRHGY
jgi:hypothetical protein